MAIVPGQMLVRLPATNGMMLINASTSTPGLMEISVVVANTGLETMRSSTATGMMLIKASI